MNSAKVLLSALAGVAIGIQIGVLIAPEKGEETRKKLSKKGDDYLDEINTQFHKFIDGNVMPVFPGTQLHEAMVAAKHIQPAAETLDLLFVDFMDELLENLHHGVFAALAILEIAHAYVVHHLGMGLIEFAQHRHIAGIAIAPEKGFVVDVFFRCAKSTHRWVKVIYFSGLWKYQ